MTDAPIPARDDDRIAANHLVDARRGKVEETITGFDCYGRALDATPDEDIPDGAKRRFAGSTMPRSRR